VEGTSNDPDAGAGCVPLTVPTRIQPHYVDYSGEPFSDVLCADVCRRLLFWLSRLPRAHGWRPQGVPEMIIKVGMWLVNGGP